MRDSERLQCVPTGEQGLGLGGSNKDGEIGGKFGKTLRQSHTSKPGNMGEVLSTAGWIVGYNQPNNQPTYKQKADCGMKIISLDLNLLMSKSLQSLHLQSKVSAKVINVGSNPFCI